MLKPLLVASAFLSVFTIQAEARAHHRHHGHRARIRATRWLAMTTRITLAPFATHVGTQSRGRASGLACEPRRHHCRYERSTGHQAFVP
jgi:hypothetical protein